MPCVRLRQGTVLPAQMLLHMIGVESARGCVNYDFPQAQMEWQTQCTLTHIRRSVLQGFPPSFVSILLRLCLPEGCCRIFGLPES